MKLLPKIALGVTLTALTGAAAYPHIDAYRKSLPVNMTKEQAAKRYLQSVCPVNKINDQAIETQKKFDEELKVTYYDPAALARANNRVGALNNNLISLAHRKSDALVVQSKALSDPKFIWPQEIRKDISFMAADAFANAANMKQAIKGEEIQADPKNVTETGNTASRIRMFLNLPVRGEGC
jgi:hypothetical protein